MKNFTKQITNKTLFKPTRWLLVALMLLLGTGSAWAAQYLYLNPKWNNDTWDKEGARFAAYFFGNGEKWVSMTKATGSNVYYVEAPDGYPNVIFCRMNGSATANNWDNKWNQTGDLNVPTATSTSRQCNISGWSSGSWGTYALGFRSTTSSHDFDDVEVNTPNASEKNIETNHKGTNFTTSNITESGDNNDEFTFSVSSTAVNVKYKPTTKGDKTVTYTITDSYGIKHVLTVTGTGVCPSISDAKSIISGFNYGNCGEVYVQHPDNNKLNTANKFLVIRYEGDLPTTPTAPTNGTTYSLNDTFADGGIVVGVGNSNQTQTTLPDVSKIYTFALYEYTSSPCLEYSELTEDRYKSTTPRTPTVTTDEPTYSGGATATLKGTFVKVGQGAGIEGYGFEWVSKPAGSNLANINKSGSIGVGTTFTADVTFDVSGTYTYKAYINSNASGACEIGYGEEKSITVSVCTRPVIVTNSAAYNPSTGLVDITYSISETGGATTHYGIQYRAKDNNFPTENLGEADFIKIGETKNTVTNATYTYQTVLTPGTYYFRTYANNGCPAFDYSVGMVYGEEIQVVVPKKDQPTLTLAGVNATYCTLPAEAITLSTTGGAGEGAVTYSIVNEGTTATATINGNQLSITKGGTLKLKATKADDNNYDQAESEVVTVTIYADIEAGSINASTTMVCQGGEVTLTLSGHTADAKITWYADDAQVATDNVKYTASNLQKATSYKVEVTRQAGTCPVKTKKTKPIQISVDRKSAITLSGNSEDVCNGETIDLTKLVSSNTGTVTWYSDETCTDAVVKPESITVNGNVTYYAQAKSGVCAAVKAPYAITAKGVTISQSPATVHPYEVTTFTASKEATWKLTANPAEGDDLSADDPTFSGKTTAYITKADGKTTTFKGETAAKSYVIKATADDCETTHTFNVEDDPNNCQ